MSSQKVAETIQETRELARAEYETKTKGLIFTKDFQTRQEALMRDPLATVGERVMAWILRRAWGEYALYAIRDDGTPALQIDCARDLKIDKRRVSAAVDYLKGRGYLLDIPGKKLYPSISPVLVSPPEKSEKSAEYRTFLQSWKVAHSTDFEELEVARSTVKRITKVLLSDYKKSRLLNGNGAASLLETERGKTETNPAAASSLVAVEKAAAAPTRPDPVLIAEELSIDVRAAQQIVADCVRKDPSLTAEEIVEVGRIKDQSLRRQPNVRNRTAVLKATIPEMCMGGTLREVRARLDLVKQQKQEYAVRLGRAREAWSGLGEVERAEVLLRYPELKSEVGDPP
jgi:hypothetical protein